MIIYLSLIIAFRVYRTADAAALALLVAANLALQLIFDFVA